MFLIECFKWIWEIQKLAYGANDNQLDDEEEEDTAILIAIRN